LETDAKEGKDVEMRKLRDAQEESETSQRRGGGRREAGAQAAEMRREDSEVESEDPRWRAGCERGV